MRTRYTVVFTLFFLLISAASYAQPGLRYRKKAAEPTEDLEEIKDKIYILQKKKGRNNDSLRLELLNSLAVLYTPKSKDTALYYAQAALKEAKELDLKNLIAVSLYNTGSVYEFYNDRALAEENYLLWMEVRKKQSDDEYRWTLHKLREFYIKYKDEPKLQKIQDEWMVVLDRQLDRREVTPWFDYDDGTPEGSYRASTVASFDDLVEGGYYFIAEKSFLHMVQKCPKCIDWSYDDTPYQNVEFVLGYYQDTTTLTVWYEHWYDAMVKYGPGKEYTLERFKEVSVEYYSAYNYQKRSKYFDKFFPLLMNYTYKAGGDQAVHEMLLESRKTTVATYLIKIKLNLYLMESCMKVKDQELLDKLYKETEQLVSEYLSKGKSKDELSKLLTSAKNKNTDKQFVKWCDQMLGKIK